MYRDLYIYINICGCCLLLLDAGNDIHCHVVGMSLPDHGCRGVLGFALKRTVLSEDLVQKFTSGV